VPYLRAIHNSPRQVVQRKQWERRFGPAIRRQEGVEEEQLQMQAKPKTIQWKGLDDEELLQGMMEPLQRQEDLEDDALLQGTLAASETPAQFRGDSGQQENRTGMPDNLKAGIETLSGLSMDDVNVHYNSSKPAQVQALAYTQGTDIHVGPGQAQHLPHEAWHVVQQKQGRVQSTLQLKSEQVNDDPGLEREAEVMGKQALQMRRPNHITTDLAAQIATEGQRAREMRDALEVAGAAIESPAAPVLTIKKGILLKGRYLKAGGKELSTTHENGAVIQRAVGMEFECSHLTIDKAPKGAKKGDEIEELSSHGKLTYEETSEGTPVAEFVVKPAAEIALHLADAVQRFMITVRGFEDKKPRQYGDYQISPQGPLDGNVQITMGVPSGRLTKIYELYRGEESSAPSPAWARWVKLEKSHPLQTPLAVTPDGDRLDSLSQELKGFIVLLMDYIEAGYVPPDQMGKAEIPFAKGLYKVMARTDIQSIFKTLPEQDKDRIATRLMSKNPPPKWVELRPEWIQWIIQLANGERAKGVSPGGGMIGQKEKNRPSPPKIPSREEYLKAIPKKDLLSEYVNMGLGELGNKVDQSTYRDAPIFEVREPYGAAVPYRDWMKKAEETWKNYTAIVGHETYWVGGTVREDIA